MSAKETALGALVAALEAAAVEGGDLEGVVVVRNQDVPVSPADIRGGAKLWVNVVDGDPGEPEVALSPPTWYYEHEAEIEVLVLQQEEGALDGAFDALLVAVAGVLEADPTLGGAVTNPVAVDQPRDVQTVPMGGGAPAKGGTIPVILSYSTTNPLT